MNKGFCLFIIILKDIWYENFLIFIYNYISLLKVVYKVYGSFMMLLLFLISHYCY